MIETDVEKVPRRAWLLRSQNKCVVQFFTVTIQTTPTSPPPTKHTTKPNPNRAMQANQPTKQPALFHSA
jgi:hypothetical protein